MRRLKKHGILSFLLCIVLMFGITPVRAEENIKHSTTDYDATFYDATDILISNEKAVEWEVGKKFFLHYTVTKLEKNKTNQCGMMVTKDPNIVFPYEQGGMHYGMDMSLCEEGYTYLFRFEVTKNGLKYVAGKAKGDKSSYIQFPYSYGELKTEAPYFGVWITGTDGGSLSAELKNIRCYDEDGNDLGVSIPKASKITKSKMNSINMEHTYSFSVEKAHHLAFGSERYSKSKVIMLEYTPEDVKVSGVTQSGALITNAPTAIFPYAAGSGYLNFDYNDDKNPTNLLTEGANYLVRMERDGSKMSILVKRTLPNGAVDYFSFANNAGELDEKFGYFMMWFGEECKITANFTNVKCYDEKGNNLAIQTNQGIEIKHYGGLEDYTPCSATYYCESNQMLLVLDKQCGAVYKKVNDEVVSSGKYSVDGSKMKLELDGKKQECTYTYQYVKDAEGNKYFRLRDMRVTFKSKLVGGEVISETVVNEKSNFRITQPKNPTGGNGDFVCWVDGEGNEFDFDSIIAESKTLYATWSGNQTYEAVESTTVHNNTNIKIIITAAICLVLIGATIATCIIIIRKKDDYEEK